MNKEEYWKFWRKQVIKGEMPLHIYWLSKYQEVKKELEELKAKQ